jgi:glutamate-1-semialdehyde 2,1-aminomutase
MDAIRIARAATGHDTVVKIEGSYHGHHDTVMFSVVPNADAMGGREAPASTPMSRGIPAEMAKWTLAVPFNDAEAVRTLFEQRASEIACLIIEPVMMNIGMVLPQPGYLEALRDLCTRHGVVLIFDEVKSGATIAAGGAIERYGVQPDLACFAKAIGGGTPAAAFGGKAEVMDVIEHGAAQQGTFNGNPLVTAAGLAALTEVLTPDAYALLDALGTRLASGCAKAVAEHGLPAHTVDLGAKGCVSYRAEPLTNYRDFLETRTELYEASFPWVLNRGVFMTPGDEEQWTISVQHTEADIDRYVDAFAEFCAAVAGAE